MKRHAVIVALYANHTDLEISNFLKCARSFVYKVRCELKASGGNAEPVSKRKKHEERSHTIRSAEFVQKVQAIIDEDPSKSIRALAKDLNVSDGLIRRVVHEDLRYKSYVMRRGQFMSDKTREQRVIRSNRLLNEIKHPEAAEMLWFFSDEKNFDQDQKINRRNDRWLCSNPTEVPVVMHTKFPATVMVLGVVSNKGHVMPPHFFSQGLRVNSAAYIEVLETVVKPWIESVCGDSPYIFQQYYAPSHKAMATQDWMAENFHDHITPNLWPPSSPDLNLLDYYVWGVVERETNKHPHNTISSLKTAINTVMVNMNKDHLIRACNRFRSRFEKVIAANGNFIE
ncbi:uncharacterized protein LOC124461437 [Drosophila willistoni]|uniref:uncharacterized protein LOC124461437 n=1 Tax=Drosophila willistoni TaxID=7260 RepID=UPI001F073AF0|nr:uncharacterized protein LOC124461437 [Drosophila willistoni]XP_046868910.1 uncharacterized protein LOC124461437 [Drosophila willistoni]